MNLQLVRLVGNPIVVEYQVIRDNELVLLVTTQQRIVNFLLRHVTFLLTQACVLVS